METNNPVHIDVKTQYMPAQSSPKENRYAFAYTITITNQGKQTVQLISRHWLITDGNNRIQEVRGEGVVGEQPFIEPGESYRYTSGAMLDTAVGSMEGSYRMTNAAGESFDAPIAPFILTQPGALH